MRKYLVFGALVVLLISAISFYPAPVKAETCDENHEGCGSCAMPEGCLMAQAAPAAEPAKTEPPAAPAPAADAAKPAEPATPAEPAKGAEGAPPETINFDKVGKMGPVAFPHALHGKKNECKDCHEGDKPLFEKKKTGVEMKMADMYAGKNCGACHNGKKAFEAKKSCVKCHKKK